jgi:hypothetical protein
MPGGEDDRVVGLAVVAGTPWIASDASPLDTPG